MNTTTQGRVLLYDSELVWQVIYHQIEETHRFFQKLNACQFQLSEQLLLMKFSKWELKGEVTSTTDSAELPDTPLGRTQRKIMRVNFILSGMLKTISKIREKMYITTT